MKTPAPMRLRLETVARVTTQEWCNTDTAMRIIDPWVEIKLASHKTTDLKRLRVWLDKAIAWMESK